MTSSTAAALRELERIKGEFGGDAAERKRARIRELRAAEFERSADLLRFHEALCFARAYPDDAATLALVERILERFDRRADVRWFRDELLDSGVAGTDVWYPFYFATAQWIVGRWPDRLTIDWEEFTHREKVPDVLPLLLPYTESPALDELDHEPKEWIDLLKGPRESDAAFLVRRIDALRIDEFGKEALYDAIDAPVLLRGEGDTPSRTKARWPRVDVTFQTEPFDRRRPDLRADVRVPPTSVRSLSRAQGRELIDLSKVSMITRSRDLDAFCYADPDDVRLVDCGGGLCFALMGALPERRLMLESSYGMLTLKNGVPIGYVLISAAFGSAAIAYNVFDTFRGAEAARVFGRVLAVAHHVFGADSFSVDPYQLGHNNEEGLRSGAWWFYQKLGFRPADPAIDRLMRRELRRMKADPGHRSDLETMRELVVDHVYFHLDAARDDVLGKVSLGEIGLKVSRRLARRFGSDRETAIRDSAHEAAELCGVEPGRGWKRTERLWWDRWSPVLLTVPGIRGWSAAERRAAAEVVRAKGGRHESEFVLRLDAHRKLRRGLLALAAE